MKEALKLALEALEEIALAGMSGTGQESKEAMTEWHARQAWKFIGIAARQLAAIKEVLAQPEQEPVANWQKRHPDETGGMWVDTNAADAAWWAAQKFEHGWEVREFYTTPPQRKPLSNEEIGQAARDAHIAFCLNKHQTYEHALTRAIEAAHGIIKG